MLHHLSAYSIALFLSGLLTAALGVFAWYRRCAAPVTRLFAALLFTMTFYSVGYGFELTCSTLQAAMFWARFEYLGIALLPAVWILLAIRFAGRDRWIRPGTLSLIFLVPAVVLIAVYTMKWHNLYYIAPRLWHGGPIPLLVFEKGPIYRINTAFTLAAFGGGSLLLVRQWLRAPALYRSQAAMLVMGSLFPGAAFMLYSFGALPRGIDVTAFTLTLSAAAAAVGIFRHRFLDIVPVARERIFEAMRDGAIILDAFGRIVDFNPAARDTIPALTSSAIGLPANELLPDLGDAVESAELTIVVHGEEQHFEVRRSPLRGKRRDPIGRVVMLIDVTEQVRLRRYLQRLASVDDLTEIDNRRSFLQRSRQELARGRRFGRPATLVLMDLDHFKRVNDSFGHEAGDEVLRTVARVCRAGLRDFDLFGRYGGEEFAFFLPETPVEMGRQTAERLRSVIETTPIVKDGARLTVTASIGVAGTSAAGAEGIEELVRRADVALYRAKQAGRNCLAD